MTHLKMGLLALVCLFSIPAPAWAHKPSDSYLRIIGGGEHLRAEWDIALKDLEFLVGLDTNDDSRITWGELKARRQAVTARALSRLSISVDGEDCDLRATDLLVNEHSDGAYATLVLTSDCPGDAEVIRIRYNLLFQADPTHRGLVLYRSGELSSTHVLSPSEPTLTLRTGEAGLWQALVDYVQTGVWHIWIGFDHILFLLTLLLPAVLVRRENTWKPVDAFRPACMAVLKIVTMFTLAHSITLWLAVMQYAALPGRLVEAGIAFSIVITALHNLYPRAPLPGWAIAFGFGLLHGFGFANVLVDLGLSSGTLAVALFGFNVGVELGQIVIVAAFFPVAFLLRDTWFYRWIVLRAGSGLIAIIAGLWMIERIFNIQIIGF